MFIQRTANLLIPVLGAFDRQTAIATGTVFRFQQLPSTRSPLYFSTQHTQLASHRFAPVHPAIIERQRQKRIRQDQHVPAQIPPDDADAHRHWIEERQKAPRQSGNIDNDDGGRQGGITEVDFNILET